MRGEATIHDTTLRFSFAKVDRIPGRVQIFEDKRDSNSISLNICTAKRSHASDVEAWRITIYGQD
jgi:hypothetical protein